MKILKLLTIVTILIQYIGLNTVVAADDKKHIAEISLAILAQIEGRGKAEMLDKIYLNERLIIDPVGLVRLRFLDSKEIELFGGIHQLVTKINSADKVQYLVLVSQQKDQKKTTEGTLDETLQSEGGDSVHVSNENGDEDPVANAEQKQPEESNTDGNDDGNNDQSGGGGGIEPVTGAITPTTGNSRQHPGLDADENFATAPPASNPIILPIDQILNIAVLGKMTQTGFVTMPTTKTISSNSFNLGLLGKSVNPNFVGMGKSPGLEKPFQPNVNKSPAITSSTFVQKTPDKQPSPVQSPVQTFAPPVVQFTSPSVKQSIQPIISQPIQGIKQQLIAPKLLLNNAILQNKVKAIQMK